MENWVYFDTDMMWDFGINVEFLVDFDESGLFSGFEGILGVELVSFEWWENGKNAWF